MDVERMWLQDVVTEALGIALRRSSLSLDENAFHPLACHGIS